MSEFTEGLDKTEFTKNEWWEVAKIAKPGITRKEYNIIWRSFIEKKRAGTLSQD